MEWLGISLVVQWLRLLNATAGGLGLIPGEGTRSHMLQLGVRILGNLETVYGNNDVAAQCSSEEAAPVTSPAALRTRSRKRQPSAKQVADIAQQGSMQLSMFQLDDPVFIQIRDQIKGLDINSLTPIEALNKLNEIKKITGL